MALCTNERIVEKMTEALPDVKSIAADLGDPERVEAIVQQAQETLGKIDIQVHVCGGEMSPATTGLMVDAETGAMADAVRRRLRPAFLCNREVLSSMIRQGAGQIINVIGPPCDGFEASAQAGAIGLTASIAEEVRQYGIRVQAVTCRTTDEVMPQHVADVVCRLLTLPADVTLGHVEVSPATMARRQRKRRRRHGGESPPAKTGGTHETPKSSETGRLS